MKYYKYTYRVKNGSNFRFNEEGDLLKEVNVVTTEPKKALNILETNYPYFKKSEVVLKETRLLDNLFKP